MEKWLVYGKKADFNKIAKQFFISPYLARIIRNRDIKEELEYKEYLECNINNLNSPRLLKDMDKAVEIIYDTIRNGDKIRVIGDYDIDGVCAGYIITNGLKKMGADIDFDVPTRVADGYGINKRLIDKANSDKVSLIITCDNGIAAYEQTKYAKKLGMKIIITDHHEVPFVIEDENKKYILPKADAVVDYKQKDCEYPFKDLCGATIGYKLIEAYYDKYSYDDEKINKDNKKFLNKYLVFAAIATVGDVVPLHGENRIIVKNGLEMIKDVDNYGLKALIKVNELDEIKINSYHISFVIGPCINSGGRIDTAKRVFDLFECEEEKDAYIMADELKKINEERKLMTIEGTKKAVELVENDEKLKNSKILIIYIENCHESIAGIIAGRLKDIFYKPVFVFTDAEEGLKGSGRSIEGYSMFEELTLANELYKKENNEGLFLRFGGHKMAAGITIEKNKIEIMRTMLNLADNIEDDIFVRKIWIDIPLPFEYLTKDFISELDLLEPFGMANERPVFADKCVEISNLRFFGKSRNVISMKLTNSSGNKMDAICFMTEEEFIKILSNKVNESGIKAILSGNRVDIALNIIYYPEINKYMGYENIRVVIKRIS